MAVLVKGVQSFEAAEFQLQKMQQHLVARSSCCMLLNVGLLGVQLENLCLRHYLDLYVLD